MVEEIIYLALNMLNILKKIDFFDSITYIIQNGQHYSFHLGG